MSLLILNLFKTIHIYIYTLWTHYIVGVVLFSNKHTVHVLSKLNFVCNSFIHVHVYTFIKQYNVSICVQGVIKMLVNWCDTIYPI